MTYFNCFTEGGNVDSLKKSFITSTTASHSHTTIANAKAWHERRKKFMIDRPASRRDIRQQQLTTLIRFAPKRRYRGTRSV